MKNYKKLLSAVLAMVLTLSVVPADVRAAELTNLALGKTATANDSEAASLGADKAIDGDTSSKPSRWSSAEAAGPHWVAIDLGEEKTFESVRIFWEMRKATKYSIQVSNDGTTYTDAKVIDGRPSALEDVIVMDEPTTARYVRLYIESFTADDPDGGVRWNTVSIYEMEVYDGVYVKPVAPIDAITVTTPEKGDKKLEVNIPETDDFIITYNGTDYEQVIGEDLTIYEPVVDTTVKVSFKVVNKADESDYEFKEIEVTVPGTYTQEDGDNEAPAVIPELREWKGYTGEFTVSENAKVVVASEELQDMAEAFAADYEDMTGRTMEIAVGTEEDAKEGDFYFELVAPAEKEVTRLEGATRIDTGLAIAEALKEVLGVTKFENVVIATSGGSQKDVRNGFADALAGGYLAYVKKAPIILVNDNNAENVAEYVKDNLAENGTAYILGGTAVVSETVEAKLEAALGYEAKRLQIDGKGRYFTNLEILKEAGVKGGEMIVATGENFADSLSASASKLPILMVRGTALTDAQKEFLAAAEIERFYIVGGESAVQPEMEAELAAYASAKEDKVVRVAGADRRATSIEIAKKFCENPDTAVVATASFYADGLCGGPLAAALDAPLVLTVNNKTSEAAAYTAELGIKNGYILGGTSAMTEESKTAIFGSEATEEVSFGLKEEGYLMEIKDVVNVKAETPTGAFWATRTILQALKSNDMTTIPQGITRDYPLYKVRGIILDVGRKTFKLDFLEQMAKQMSWYKMNDFHVHLNDNLIFLEDCRINGLNPEEAYSGFRLESDVKAGDTVELKAVENGVETTKTFTYQADLTSKDVFYTKDDFRNFMQEAAVMGVNIVPEFDTPAHALAFTKVIPELSLGEGVRNGRGLEELDLTNQYEESLDFVTNVFDEYMAAGMEDPVFTEGGVVHVGCDEYFGENEGFRKYCRDIADYVESTGRTARMWGSLSAKRGTTVVDGTGIQMNMWSASYAVADEMYELGFDMIDCNEGPYYIVPNAGYYNDYLDASTLYNEEVNNIAGVDFPAGDKQILGGAFALWNDMVDLYDNGISEYDCYKRLTTNMGLFAAKTWGKGDMTLQEAQEVNAVMGDAPNTNFGYEVEANENYVVADWTEEEIANLAEAGVNASKEEIDGGVALKLNGGESYVTTGMETVGLDHELTVMVQRTSDSTEDQILFESEYGSIKAVQGTTGKVGITRENRDYSFDYVLPVDAWVELTFKNSFEMVSLYVNGELVDTIGDDEQCVVVKNTGKETVRPLLATCMFPAAKIGSETNAFEGYVANVSIKAEDPRNKPDYDGNDLPTVGMTVTAGSEEKSEGSLEALLDGKTNTFYHSNWSDEQNLPQEEDFWITIELPEVTAVSALRYLPRQDSANGRILSYVVSYSLDGKEWIKAAEGDWADNNSWKKADFGKNVEAKYVKIYAADSKGTGTKRFLTGAELRLVKAKVNEVPSAE